MANSYFQFKKFTVYHNLCAMKVGTDGVLLGAWCDLNNAKRILDIGTGTGLIALMAAQRSPALIDAIDIDKDACRQAEENIKNSPFSTRIKVFHSSLTNFTPFNKGKYDRIVSNPPYFSNSLKCPNLQRNTARHTDTLSITELINSTKALLKEHGIFAIILPYDQKEQLMDTTQRADLHLSHETLILPTPGAEPKRILAEFTHENTGSPKRDQLEIEIARHQYTDQYIALTKDFYLKM